MNSDGDGAKYVQMVACGTAASRGALAQSFNSSLSCAHAMFFRFEWNLGYPVVSCASWVPREASLAPLATFASGGYNAIGGDSYPGLSTWVSGHPFLMP